MYTSVLEEYYDIIKNDTDYEILKTLSERRAYNVDEIAKAFCNAKVHGLDEDTLIQYLHHNVEKQYMENPVENNDYAIKASIKLMDYSIKLGKKYYCP